MIEPRRDTVQYVEHHATWCNKCTKKLQVRRFLEIYTTYTLFEHIPSFNAKFQVKAQIPRKDAAQYRNFEHSINKRKVHLENMLIQYHSGRLFEIRCEIAQ